ncbi:hypothetical protein NDU88_006408 [Pleurodeles waltl]|uniref:Uncharacterized protein n=1 Tax=Pleurodeles waltl TaxID=8319 RepID=A0AAV7X1G5_PLEWA|nr:hypothetical protein NDU88_006408 [Pleurodeles waltl]
MSVTDPHLMSLWCPERDHDSKPCSDCWAMSPKALREQFLKLVVAQRVTPSCAILYPRPWLTPRLPNFPGAGVTPPQLKEFYKAMCLIFERDNSSGVPLGPEESKGAPSGSALATPTLALMGPMDLVMDPDQGWSCHATFPDAGPYANATSTAGSYRWCQPHCDSQI